MIGGASQYFLLGGSVATDRADEARTFGMDAYFPTAKIYNPNGMHYTSVDRELLLAYKESVQGQILHVGINEAGAMSSWIAAATSYSAHGVPMPKRGADEPTSHRRKGSRDDDGE